MALQTIEANKFRRISAHIEPEQEGLACLHLFSRHVVLAVVSDRAAQRLVVLPDRPAVQCTRFLLYIHTRCECVSVEQTCGPIRTENAQWHHSLSTHAFNVMPTDQIKSPLIFAMGGKRKGGGERGLIPSRAQVCRICNLTMPARRQGYGSQTCKNQTCEKQTCNKQNFNTDSPRHDALATSPRPILLAGNTCISVTHLRMRSRASVPLEIWWILILPFFITCATAASMRGQ